MIAALGKVSSPRKERCLEGHLGHGHVPHAGLMATELHRLRKRTSHPPPLPSHTHLAHESLRLRGKGDATLELLLDESLC